MQSTEIKQLLEERRSIRKFDEGRPVPDEVVADILAAQRVASSAANLQPLRYAVVRSPALVDAVFPLLKWAARLPPELGVPQPGERPVLYVAVLVDTQVKSPWAQIDAGLALSNITLAAQAHGIASCILASVDRPALAQLLALPAELEINTVVAFGYPAVSSRVVDPAEGDGTLGYYLDEDRNYCVPKRPIVEAVRIY